MYKSYFPLKEQVYLEHVGLEVFYTNTSKEATNNITTYKDISI